MRSFDDIDHRGITERWPINQASTTVQAVSETPGETRAVWIVRITLLVIWVVVAVLLSLKVYFYTTVGQLKILQEEGMSSTLTSIVSPVVHGKTFWLARNKKILPFKIR